MPPLKAELDEQRRLNLEKARELLTRSCLWTLVADAEQRMDIAAWRNIGGFELQDLLDCIERGLPHPLLRAWEQRKAENANRPAPSFGDLRVRRLVIQCCAALEQNGLKPGKARAFAASRLAPPFHGQGPSADAIRRWQQAQPLGREDDTVINAALKRSEWNNERIAEYFAGFILFAHDATVSAIRK
jgi:hypothetical protein